MTQQHKPEEATGLPVEVGIPVEYFHVRLFALVLVAYYVAWMLTFFFSDPFGIPPITNPFTLGPALWVLTHGTSLEVYAFPVVVFLFIAEVPAWVIGLFLWVRVTVVGYWWIGTVAHVAFVVRWLMLIPLEGQVSPILENVFWAALFWFFVLQNIYYGRLLPLFTKIDGRCPLCLNARGTLPKKNRTWWCNSCNRAVVWRKVLKGPVEWFW